MKLITDVTPRGDGTVTAITGGNRYVFERDEGGRLACEVESQADADALLDTGNFYPATEDDSEIDTAADAAAGALAALEAAQAAHDAEPTEETAAALEAAQAAFSEIKQTAIAALSKPKAKGKKK